MSFSPSVGDFTEVLSADPGWYVLCTFLGVPNAKLDPINTNYRLEGVERCLIEAYNYLQQNEAVPTWKTIATALRRKGNIALAREIETTYRNSLHSDVSTYHSLHLNM